MPAVVRDGRSGGFRWEWLGGDREEGARKRIKMRRWAAINRGRGSFEVGVAWHCYNLASTRRRPRVPGCSGGDGLCRRRSEEEEDNELEWGPLISEIEGGAVGWTQPLKWLARCD